MSGRAVASLTLRAIRNASDPDASAWVSAHAGSGKTHVLVQRVMRLLLSGAAPSQILCITFTKAAAANMSSRIFERLGRWTLLDDETLSREIEDMSGLPSSPAALRFARRLFARAVETPGGLKIQTIHAFCERLLHLFPLESNTPAGFRVLEEAEQAELLEAAKQRALHIALRDDATLRAALETVAFKMSQSDFSALCDELLAHRESFAHGGDYEARLLAQLGLRPHETVAQIEQEMIHGGEPPENWPALSKALRRGTSNDNDLAKRLETASAQESTPERVDSYISVFFTNEGEPRGLKKKIITNGLAEAEPGLLERMERERDRLAPLLEKRKAATAARRSAALARLGDTILTEYVKAKRYRNLLDFDDLIYGARRLLHRSSPSWVLYKLDSQVDHILLDEAQDTSAAQWDILTALADEFCAGVGARRIRRSFFAVGDEKQSIFSFQGAAPEKFHRMRQVFSTRFEAAQTRFENVRLMQSFRSAPGVLEAVDMVFENAENRRGFSFDALEPAPRHEAWKTDVAALVEIWEPLGRETPPEPRDWRLPLDLADATDPDDRLARKIARKIKFLLAPENRECVESGGGLRPIEAGDILILVRKRGSFFASMIRALMAEGVPVAGADRLDVARHIAVNDLVSLGRAALLVDDDLTLATVLKSPLIGLDDDNLIAIAPRRTGSLYEALAQSEQPRHRQATKEFEAWRGAASELAPFEFFSRVLGRDGGRARLVARLGPEANDAIDEFLRLAIAFEREQAPSLVAFLTMVDQLELSIKRDMEAAGEAVRVMTIHAAKGLEAKIVFLPDTCGAPSGRHDPKLFKIGDGDDEALVWSHEAASDPAPVVAARARRRDAERDEHQRLLYVALTRAEERLYVSGFYGARKPGPESWYETIFRALESGCDLAPDPLEPGATVLRRGTTPLLAQAVSPPVVTAPADAPAFARASPPHEVAAAPPLRPSSSLAGAELTASVEGDAVSPEAATRRLIGELSHALLQHLPDCDSAHRQTAAKRYLDWRGAWLSEAERREIAGRVIAVIENERFAMLFGPGSAAEVDIVATLENGLSVAGRIDRLAVTESDVLIADFKAGRPRDALYEDHLRQLALYRAAVAQLYPGRMVRCLIVWVQNASVSEADGAALDAMIATFGAESVQRGRST